MLETTLIPPHPALGAADRAELARAVDALEHVSLAVRLAGLIGRPIDIVTHLVPERARALAARATTMALRAALHVAIKGAAARKGPASNARHRVIAMAAGAAGGALGFASLPIELPASTIVMLRAIADIARENGEDMRAPETALACLEVFALGGQRGESGDNLDSSYFAARAVLARSVSEAARYIAQKGLVDEAAPALVRLVALIAQRFGVVVTQKVAAQSIPILGALGGAAVNYAFIDHFQSIARAHFAVRRLERLRGPEIVRSEYEALRMKQAKTRG